jgi:hypothetical protein
MTQGCGPRAQEAEVEAGGLWVEDHPGLYNKDLFWVFVFDRTKV